MVLAQITQYIINCSGLLTSCPGPGFVPIATMRYSGHHETLHSHHLLPIDFENTEVLDVQFVLPPGIMRWPLFLYIVFKILKSVDFLIIQVLIGLI